MRAFWTDCGRDMRDGARLHWRPLLVVLGALVLGVCGLSQLPIGHTPAGVGIAFLAGLGAINVWVWRAGWPWSVWRERATHQGGR